MTPVALPPAHDPAEPGQRTIGSKIEPCVPPGLYFEVSPSQGILEAMEALFEKVVSQARLTQ